ncbi:MAG: hypothetical protein LKG27_07100 [Clostridiaceae bacterium]|jgi:hypothetical protein|nr:hypothetical protein [Clostridiaceae bacterium]
MASDLISLFSGMFATPQTPQVSAPVTATPAVSRNPYNNNPFVSYNGNTLASYGKNKPVKGGYFAGYYNGKQNIVGQRLFIEV